MKTTLSRVVLSSSGSLLYFTLLITTLSILQQKLILCQNDSKFAENVDTHGLEIKSSHSQSLALGLNISSAETKPNTTLIQNDFPDSDNHHIVLPGNSSVTYYYWYSKVSFVVENMFKSGCQLTLVKNIPFTGLPCEWPLDKHVVKTWRRLNMLEYFHHHHHFFPNKNCIICFMVKKMRFRTNIARRQEKKQPPSLSLSLSLSFVLRIIILFISVLIV